jgi:metal-responsive CopG/Arc/MetJ family transcriptional regulator
MTKHRLQFDFSEEMLRELDELREATGLPNRAELIRNALRFLKWTFDETQRRNAAILLEKDGKQREVVFPFWTVTAGSSSTSDLKMVKR